MSFDFNREGDQKRPGRFVPPSGSPTPDTNIFRNPPEAASGFPPRGQARNNSGFQNCPVRKEERASGWGTYAGGTGKSGSPRKSTFQKSWERRHTAVPAQFPVRLVLILSVIVVAVVLCVVFKDAITSLLTTVLSWVLVIVLIIILLRIFVFKRRRW